MDADKSPLKRICIICNRHIPNDANVCPQCGHDYRPVMEGKAWEDEKTPLPPIGGALIGLSGVMQVVGGLFWILGPGFGVDYETADNSGMAIAIGMIGLLSGSFAIFVSPLTMTRRRLVLSLAAGLAALAGVGAISSYVLSGTVISTGFAGLLMIAIARDEFID